MKRYEIYDSTKRSRAACAVLNYDESTGEASIDIDARVAPEHLPFMLAIFAQRGQYRVPPDWTWKWIRERIPPEGRQNLGEVLRANKLDEYDELALLVAAQGRSAQDDFLIRPVSAYEYALVDFPDRATKQGGATQYVCEQVTAHRKAAGLTQRDLADKTGIDQATISRIEAGLASPSLDTLEALVRACGCSLVVHVQ